MQMVISELMVTLHDASHKTQFGKCAAANSVKWLF